MKENNKVWKPVVGYEGLYEVSQNGDIRNSRTNKMIKTWDSMGYNSIALSKNGIVSKFKIHRLVALTFLPNNENKPCVNHIDGNKLNNNFLNLEWCTYTENAKHAYNNLLRLPSKKNIDNLSKETIDLQTGVFYDSMKQACQCTMINYKTVINQLYNKRKCRFQYI